MDPQMYIEVDSDLQAARFREAAGRWEGLSRTNPAHPEYPIWPDTWAGSTNTPPTEPPLGSYTLYWVNPTPKIGGGAVFVLDDEMMGWFGTTPLTLSDGNEFSCNLATEAKTAEQLSAAGQAAIAPPIIEM